MILYTSDIDSISAKAAKTAFVYLMVSLFCAVFGAVYELFSHQVYSFYMIYAFGIPLIGGVLPFLAFCIFHVRSYPGTVSRNLYHSGIATLTTGSILQGILDIYGTTNNLISVYWIVGIVFIGTGVISYKHK